MRLKLFFLLPLLLAGFFTHAQQFEVTGTITSLADGFPLPGVSIQVKNSSLSTLSGPEGKYKILISDPENEILIVSFMGYLIEEVPVKKLAIIDVALTEDIEREAGSKSIFRSLKAQANRQQKLPQ